jgi:hypothetical protein
MDSIRVLIVDDDLALCSFIDKPEHRVFRARRRWSTSGSRTTTATGKNRNRVTSTTEWEKGQGVQRTVSCTNASGATVEVYQTDCEVPQQLAPHSFQIFNTGPTLHYSKSTVLHP